MLQLSHKATCSAYFPNTIYLHWGASRILALLPTTQWKLSYRLFAPADSKICHHMTQKAINREMLTTDDLYKQSSVTQMIFKCVYHVNQRSNCPNCCQVTGAQPQGQNAVLSLQLLSLLLFFPQQSITCSKSIINNFLTRLFLEPVKP